MPLIGTVCWPSIGRLPLFVCLFVVCFERHPRVECLFALVGVETIVNQVVAALHTILTILTHIRGKLGISISHFHNVTNNSKVFLKT